MPALDRTVSVIVGQPIPTDGLSADDRDALLERVRTTIVDMLEQPLSKSPARV